MKWRGDKRKPNGGYWRCRVKYNSSRRNTQARYNKTTKGYITSRKHELKIMRAKYTLQLEEIRNGR